MESGVAESNARGALAEVQRAELEALKLKDVKTKNYPFQIIDRATLEMVLNKDTSKHISDSIKKKYQGNPRARRVQFQRILIEFETFLIKSGVRLLSPLPTR